MSPPVLVQLRKLDTNRQSGKNIALAEICKFVPQFYRAFDDKLANPEKEWKEHNTWFVKQTGVLVKLSKRDVV